MKITDKKRISFLDCNNILIDFRKMVDTVILFNETEKIDPDKIEKLMEEKVIDNNIDTSNDVFKVEVDFKGEYIDEYDEGFIFYLPTADLWIENSFVYFPYIGIEKHGNEPMWCSFLDLLLNEDVKQIRIKQII